MRGIRFHETNVFRDAQLRTGWIGKLEGPGESVMAPFDGGDGFLLIVAHKGKGNVECCGKAYPLLAGCYYLALPGNPFTYNITLPVDGSVIACCFTLQDYELENIIRGIPATGTCGSADLNALEHWIRVAEQEQKGPHPLTCYRIDSGIKTTLLSLAHTALGGDVTERDMMPEQREKQHRISFPMAEYIRKHYSDKVTLGEMAKHFGFHPHYIIKMFNQRIGMSPIQYLQEIRLLKAMEFLEQTNMTVTEISESVGLTTSYFSRLFHERKGESPSQYRKRKYGIKTS
ncbi:helix-turn-helix domain-containing protein [Paenibacillus allorhizosphaerae]|uniref:HTH-type transcriptional activator RhaS n=1 Tax=Paenibacillus allorhizosphaerae TaxID=2849866 RepID=A0ABN7TK78_9BACL|nr:AraC family transcriptional regulator [Paenibacillus allorhizosphaerae]CAG7643032.1 HTH-type transcriptional activator RhaS [Paenibacillus allorhizosphaerae]